MTITFIAWEIFFYCNKLQINKLWTLWILFITIISMIYSLMYNDTEELSFTQKNKFVFGLSILIENFIFVYIQF